MTLNLRNSEFKGEGKKSSNLNTSVTFSLKNQRMKEDEDSKGFV